MAPDADPRAHLKDKEEGAVRGARHKLRAGV